MIYVADDLPIHASETVWRLWWQNFGARYGRDLGVSSAESMLMQYDASKLVGEMIAEGLAMLAAGTGGRAAIGRSQGTKLFSRMREDLTHYYSLAYPSPHRGDGGTHELEVRVKRPDLKVRHLGSYRDKSGEQQMAERTLAAAVLGLADNPLAVRVSIGKSEQAPEGGHFAVPVEVRFPLANLVLLPEQKAHIGKVSIHIVVRDQRGRVSDPVKIPLRSKSRTRRSSKPSHATRSTPPD